MKPLVFLNSHPIQYFAPLYQQINRTTKISLTVLYCSDESIRGKMDRGFGKAVKWDIPLIEGYHSVFLRNRSWKPSIHKGFFGIINPAVISFLYRQPKSVVVIHGWAYLTNILAIVFGSLFGHKICLRAETPLNQELKKNRFITFFKHAYLRMLFLFVDRFLYIGEQNRRFYRALNVGEKKMLFVPYAVDNERFRQTYESISRAGARSSLQLPVDKQIILYSGKYITKKRPMDLLKAFNESDLLSNSLLLMIGDGECRPEMESFIKENSLEEKVMLTGFINQSQIPLYYRAANFFVMCSGVGETWGLSVNEAMNFGLPVIVSDTCGSAYDLVENGVNGDVFETGNIKQLASLLNKYAHLDPREILAIEKSAFEKISRYGYDSIITSIESIL